MAQEVIYEGEPPKRLESIYKNVVYLFLHLPTSVIFKVLSV